MNDRPIQSDHFPPPHKYCSYRLSTLGVPNTVLDFGHADRLLFLTPRREEILKALGMLILGHFYLAQLLLPTLISTAKLSQSSSTEGGDGKARVVNVSSLGRRMAWVREKGGPVVYESLVSGKEREGMSPQDLYHWSKAVCSSLNQHLRLRLGRVLIRRVSSLSLLSFFPRSLVLSFPLLSFLLV